MFDLNPPCNILVVRAVLKPMKGNDAATTKEKLQPLVIANVIPAVHMANERTI
jgi:hypothetical protein